MYFKFRYSSQKYDDSKRLEFSDFLLEELRHNPSNNALRAGLLGLQRSERDPHSWHSKDPSDVEQELAELRQLLALRGTEYYVFHRRYKWLAQALYRTFDDCLAIEERLTSDDDVPDFEPPSRPEDESA
jgi:hypothetical protein